MRRPIRPASARWKPPSRMAPLARGEVAAVAVAKTPEKPAGARLQGRQRRRARRSPTGAAAPCFSTCGPPGACPAARKCRRSTRLQAKLGGAGFRGRVAINIDTRDPDKPKAWLKDAGIDTARLLRRPQRQGVPGPESGRQGLRHADDADRRPQGCELAAWRGRRNGRATTRSSSSRAALQK